MRALRLYLIAASLALLVFTLQVIGNHGAAGIGGAFFGAIAEGSWQGQFNADFLALLVPAALWTGWRSGWNLLGWVLAAATLLLGGLFLLPYLAALLHREQGDIKRFLLGVRADDLPHRRWTD